MVAEAAGWDGVFVWDHMMYRPPVERIADPWTVMAAMAHATDASSLGPMVTPIARRRAQVLARQTATLDRLSNGRLVFGVGLGGDPGGELSLFDEEMDAQVRAQLLDDGLEHIDRWWRGEESERRAACCRSPSSSRESRSGWRHGFRTARRSGGRRGGTAGSRSGSRHPMTSSSSSRTRNSTAPQMRDRGTSRCKVSTTKIRRRGLAAGATWWLVRFEPFGLPAAHVREVAEAGPPTR